MTAPQPQGPATVEAVAGWLGITDDNPDHAHVVEVVPAVNDFVRSFHTAPAEGQEWPPMVVRGAVMLAARITRRRNSPAGVESFTELGPTYVSRYDVDLDRLLGLGNYRQIVAG